MIHSATAVTGRDLVSLIWTGREARMKKFVWFIGGMAAATAGFLVWNSSQAPDLHEPDYYLDEDASDDSTFV